MPGRAGRSAPALAAVLAALATGVGVPAQTLPVGPLPRGVTVDVLERPYTVRGGTAGQILAGLRAEGRGGRWQSFRWRYEWNFTTKPVDAPSITGSRPTTCETADFEVLVTFTAVFPRWDQPDGADPSLVAAWRDFAAEVRSHWERHRDVAVGAAHDMVLRVDRVREACPLIRRETNELVRSVMDEYAGRMSEVDRGGLPPSWPPPGLADRERAEAPPPPPAPLPDRPPVADDVFGAVRRDVGGRTTGLVVAVHHQGSLDYLEAFGTAEAASEVILVPVAPFAFPAFAEILLGVVTDRLAADGAIDPAAPIARYLPELSPALGRTTLVQLLAHRAGLDNAVPPDSAAWTEILDALDDRALFTAPGAVYSHSRYSYPLAARAVERATGRSVQQLATELVLRPLAMDSTTFDLGEARARGLSPEFEWPEPRDFRAGGGEPPATIEGLPPVFTTVPDVLDFLGGWMDGALPGSRPRADGERVFSGGVWRDRVGGRTARLWTVCEAAGFAAGFYAFPETRTMGVLWGTQRWPESTASYMLHRVSAALGIGPAIFEDGELAGAALLEGETPTRCRRPRPPPVRLDPDARAISTGAWAGQYLNGDRLVHLADRDGELRYLQGNGELELVHYADRVFFTYQDGRALFPLRLLEDDDGRRYVMLGDRAFVHQEDREVRPSIR